MPKQGKTCRTALKRFKVTGKGRLLHQRVGGGHYMLKKSKRRKRDLKRTVELHPGHREAIRTLLHGQA